MYEKCPKLPSSDEESSDSDDETQKKKKEPKRKKISEDPDDEPGVQDTLKEMKMLRVLCEKVEQNEKCLMEIKTLR